MVQAVPPPVLVADVTPVVQAVLVADVSGSVRYFDRDPEGLAALLRLHTMALHGVETTCAIAPNRMLAAMAAAVTPPGATTIIEARDVQEWLRPRSRRSALPSRPGVL
ncbi:hypothetical protein [Streptomyces sp. NPDC051364]|uniref:hypothetical protein n=1 Tax=Streptomyces sp. NPDC051364 TaxID=3155799 RepID=UPI00342191A0